MIINLAGPVKKKKFWGIFQKIKMFKNGHLNLLESKNCLPEFTFRYYEYLRQNTPIICFA